MHDRIKIGLLFFIGLLIFSCTTAHKTFEVKKDINDVEKIIQVAMKKMKYPESYDVFRKNTKYQTRKIDDQKTELIISGPMQNINTLFASAVTQEYILQNGGAIPQSRLTEKNINHFILLDIINSGLAFAYVNIDNAVQFEPGNHFYNIYTNVGFVLGSILIGAADIVFLCGSIHFLQIGMPMTALQFFAIPVSIKLVSFPVGALLINGHNAMIRSGYNFEQNYYPTISIMQQKF